MVVLTGIVYSFRMVTLTCPVSNLILASVITMIAWARLINPARLHSEDPLSFYLYLGAFFLYMYTVYTSNEDEEEDVEEVAV